MPSLSSQIIAAIAIFFLLMTIFFLGFVSGKASLATDIGEITGRVEQQKAHAKQLLDTLTAERDAKQAAIDKVYKEQEQKDAKAKTDIDRLADELRARPMRVRIECPSGKSGSSAPNQKTASTHHRAGNSSTTYGLLPAANSERLANAISAVEKLNAAYSSCRNKLYE